MCWESKKRLEQEQKAGAGRLELPCPCLLLLLLQLALQPAEQPVNHSLTILFVDRAG
jgi:hypothetical protein